MAIGLVLAGGAAKGAFEVGVIAALEEAGVAAPVLSGTSAGALNAAGLAVGFDAARLAQLWESTEASDVFRQRRDLHRLLSLRGLLRRGGLSGRALDSVGWTWFLDTAPLRATLVAALGGERLTVKEGTVLTVSAVEMATGQLVRFTNRLPADERRARRFRQVELGVDHLMASSAIPVAFRPAAVEGHAYWDGGLVANTPLAPVLAYDVRTVVIVTTATRERPAAEPRTLGQVLSLMIDNVLAHSLAADLDHAQDVNALCRQAPAGTAAGRRVVDFLLVEPVGLDLGQGLRFGAAEARRRIDLGYAAGEAAIRRWRDEGRL